MCSGPKWKREEVTDHKFDFIDTRDFIDNGFMMRVKYLWLYLVVLKSFLVYISDIFTATTMLTTKSWSNEIFNECANTNQCIFIPFQTGKWLFVGCILFGFLLLAYESRKAKRIIASRDISYAFTNVMANNYYSLRSYSHFCFFEHISDSTKLSDDFAFFVFFTFKSWKRLLLADGPRQTINGLTLYAIFIVKSKGGGNWYDVSRYFQGSSMSTAALTVTTFFTVAVFVGSLLLLIVAAICYIPLLCHIRGNLKEYCCHKVDKRIEEVITRQREKRLQEAAKNEEKEARGDFSHLKNKKGAKPLPQPTLPNLSVDDEDDTMSIRTRGPPPSTYTQDSNYYYQDQNYPPPMPGYNPYSHHQRVGSGAQYEGSQAHLAYDQYQYDEDAESTAHLAAAAAPFAQQAAYDRPGSARPFAPSPAPSYRTQGPYQNHPTQMQHSSLAYSQSSGVPSGMPYDDRYGSMASHENPYVAYASHHNSASQSQLHQGRQQDEESRGYGM